VYVDVDIRDAMRMLRDLLPVSCPAEQNFSTLSHKSHDFREKKLSKMFVMIFSTTFICSMSDS